MVEEGKRIKYVSFRLIRMINKNSNDFFEQVYQVCELIPEEG